MRYRLLTLDLDGTVTSDDLRIRPAVREAVREVFNLTPQGIIKYLDLLRPIYKKTAVFGHFGRNDPDFTWESTHRTDDLRTACGV